MSVGAAARPAHWSDARSDGLARMYRSWRRVRRRQREYAAGLAAAAPAAASASASLAAAARAKEEEAGRFRYVYFDAKTGKWRAWIRHLGVTRQLGYHETAEDAARAHDLAARERFGAKARLNFPDPEPGASPR